MHFMPEELLEIPRDPRFAARVAKATPSATPRIHRASSRGVDRDGPASIRQGPSREMPAAKPSSAIGSNAA